MFGFELGEILKDKITGFKGVVMGRTEYFTDCIHYGLLSQKLSDSGKPIDWQWFDETRLIKVKGVKKVEKEPRKSTSGLYPNAPEN